MKIRQKAALMLIAGTLSLSSCSDIAFNDSFLDQKPESVGLTLEEMFSAELFAEQVLTAAYAHLPVNLSWGSNSAWDGLSGGVSEELTDIAQCYNNDASPFKLYYTGNYNASTVNSTVNYAYTSDGQWECIRNAYLYLENVDKVPDMTDDLKEIRKGEAKMLLAIQYFEMLEHVGGIVWLDGAVDIKDVGAFHNERLTIRQSVEKIVGLLDDAIKVLPWNYDVYQSARMTRAAARALKVRTLLYAASPLYNNDEPFHADANELTWLGGYDESLWADAEKAAEEFMTDWEQSGYYEVIDLSGGVSAVEAQAKTDDATKKKFGSIRKGYIKGYWERGNNETLISIRTNSANGDKWEKYSGSMFFRSWAPGFPWNCPTLEYFEMFPMANGDDFPADFDWSNPSLDPFKNRDPRLYENIVIPGDWYSPWNSNVGNIAHSYEGGAHSLGIAASSGFRLRKWALEYGNTSTYGVGGMYQRAHTCYLRLPEVLLSYAEILNKRNSGPTDKAYDLVDRVRMRVGLPALPAAKRTMNEEEFLQYVLRERAIELGFEDIRWMDVARHKLKESMTKPLHGLKIVKDASAAYGFTFTKVALPERYLQKAGKWDSKWFLSAFPRNEVVKGYGLEQNPGW